MSPAGRPRSVPNDEPAHADNEATCEKPCCKGVETGSKARTFAGWVAAPQTGGKRGQQSCEQGEMRACVLAYVLRCGSQHHCERVAGWHCCSPGCTHQQHSTAPRIEWKRAVPNFGQAGWCTGAGCTHQQRGRAAGCVHDPLAATLAALPPLSPGGARAHGGSQARQAACTLAPMSALSGPGQGLSTPFN